MRIICEGEVEEIVAFFDREKKEYLPISFDGEPIKAKPNKKSKTEKAKKEPRRSPAQSSRTSSKGRPEGSEVQDKMDKILSLLLQVYPNKQYLPEILENLAVDSAPEKVRQKYYYALKKLVDSGEVVKLLDENNHSIYTVENGSGEN